MPHQPKPVHVLAFPNVQLLDVTGPLQVFAAANVMAHEAGLKKTPYRPEVIARDLGSVVSSAGLGLLTQPLPSTPSDSMYLDVPMILMLVTTKRLPD